MPFTFSRESIADVVVVTPRLFPDERGMFAELYKESDFAAEGIDATFVQVNHSTSAQGVLRGLHYQLPPKAQGKLVSVTRGTVFDVAVDLRKSSATYKQWVGRALDAAERTMLYIPEGFAHGFCVTSEGGADVVYYCTEEYSPEHERGIMWNDEELGITWPIEEPVLSEKDVEFPVLAEAEHTFA